jgi:hypothetical protein
MPSVARIWPRRDPQDVASLRPQLAVTRWLQVVADIGLAGIAAKSSAGAARRREFGLLAHLA